MCLPRRANDSLCGEFITLTLAADGFVKAVQIGIIGDLRGLEVLKADIWARFRTCFIAAAAGSISTEFPTKTA